jgi:hypothetical protein
VFGQTAIQLPTIDTGPFNFRASPIQTPSAPRKARLSLLDWTARRRAELGPGKPFDLNEHAYLRELYTLTAQESAVQKSAQSGLSEWLISKALHACDERALTVLYVFPTDTHVSDFSAARLGPAIEASDYLAQIVVDGSPLRMHGKRGADRVTLKRVRDRFLYFRGGKVQPDGSAPQLKSIDADLLIQDELDELDPRAPAIAAKRLGHSRVAEICSVSTPTYPGRGIHAVYMASDMRQWHVRCASCGHRQPLEIADVVTAWDELERPTSWHGQAENRAYCACRKCGREIDRLGAGEWVASYPGRAVAGYHVTKLFSPIAKLLDIVLRLQSTNETVRRETFNQDLGLPYRLRGGGLDDVTLDACIREYAHGPRAGIACNMGIDVGRVLHVVVRSALMRGERRQLYAGECSWADLPALWQRFRPRRTVIDALPETTKAREFQASRPDGSVWLAYYTLAAIGSKDEAPYKVKEEGGTVDLDRTRILDLTMARFLKQADAQSPENTLPANARDLPDYYAQMKSPVRVLEKDARGQDVAQYVESGPDHYAHAEGYCAAASLLVTTAPVAFAQGSAKGWNP